MGSVHRLDEIREGLQQIGLLGNKHDLPIDPGILEMVVVLNALEFTTYTSCEGHNGTPWGTTMPFVCIGSDDPRRGREMKRRFRELLERFYGKCSVSSGERIYMCSVSVPIYGFSIHSPLNIERYGDLQALSHAQREMNVLREFLMNVYI